jgi:hypothetical protein
VSVLCIGRTVPKGYTKADMKIHICPIPLDTRDVLLLFIQGSGDCKAV